MNEKAYKFSTRDSTEFTVEDGGGTSDLSIYNVLFTNERNEIITILVNTVEIEEHPMIGELLYPEMTCVLDVKSRGVVDLDPVDRQDVKNVQILAYHGHAFAFMDGNSDEAIINNAVVTGSIEIKEVSNGDGKDQETYKYFDITGDGTITFNLGQIT